MERVRKGEWRREIGMNIIKIPCMKFLSMNKNVTSKKQSKAAMAACSWSPGFSEAEAEGTL